MPEGSLVKAIIYSCDREGNDDGSCRFPVQFNPNEITIEEAAGDYVYDLPFSKKNVSERNTREIQRRGTRRKDKTQMSVTLFYNTYNKAGENAYEDVRTEIKKFFQFLNKETKDKSSFKKIGFQWGSLQISGVLARMSTRYRMFAPSGIPVRAEVSIMIEGEYQGSSGENEGNRAVLGKNAKLSEMMAGSDDATGYKKAAKAAGIVNPRKHL